MSRQTPPDPLLLAAPPGRRRRAFPLLLLLAAFAAAATGGAGCSHIRLLQSPKAAPDDWIMYGGAITRTNAAKSIVRPPLVPLWEYDMGAGFGPYSAAVADSLVFVGNLQGEVEVIRIATGKGVGSRDFGSAVAGTPVVENGSMYVPLAYDPDNLLSYDLTEGAVDWKARTGDIETSPLLIGRRLFVTTLEGGLVCLNAADGQTVWRFNVPGKGRTTMIRSSPASDSNVVVFGCDDGNIYAVGIGDGSLRWSAQTGASVVASPTVQGGRVFVGSLDRNFYAFDVASGKELWKQSLGAGINGSQAAAGRNVFVGTSGGNLYCLDAATGGVVWKATPNSAISAAPLVCGDVLYVGCLDKTLYAYDTASGRLLWKYAARGRIRGTPVASKQLLIVCIEDRTVMAFRESER